MEKEYQGTTMMENDKLRPLRECLQAFTEKSFYSTITMITEERVRESIYEIGR